MILPNNGKVIIVDDNPKDVENLAAALTKEKMPFLFFHELGMEDLPDSPIENVRLVFLDFDLGIGNSETEKVRLLQERLFRLIEPDTPYVLIIWSTHEDRYAKLLKQDFEEHFREYKPIATCSLQKEELQKYPKDQAAAVINVIRERLKEQFSDFSSFNAFLMWESIVNNAAGAITKKVTDFYRNKDVNWNNTTKYLLHKLAKAYSGTAGENYDSLTRLKNALYTLSNPLVDNVDVCINKIKGDLFDNLVSKDQVEIENFNSALNKTLLISNQIDSIVQPGNIYFPIEELNFQQENINSIWQSKLDGIEKIPQERRDKAKESTNKKCKEALGEVDSRLANTRKKYNNLINGCLNTSKIEVEQEKRERIFGETIYIDLNVTPICDFAQKKTSVFRFLPGILIKDEFKEYLVAGTAYLYISDPVVHILHGNYIFVFDFRFLYSVMSQDIEYKKPEYRLKHQLLSDIQVKLSSHVSRSGIYFID